MPLEGRRVILREETPDDLPFLVELRNNLETQGWPKTLPPDTTLSMYRKRYEAREFSFDRFEGRFVIAEKASGDRIGTVGYYGLEPRFEATIGIAVAKPFWGTGMALDAQEIILRFLFLELGVRVVRLWTHSGNPSALGLAGKSGFQVSARRRQAVFQNGQLSDTVVMDLLREEYFALHPEYGDTLPALF